MSESIQYVRVVLTTEVLGLGGRVLTSVTNTQTEQCGNPAFVGRVGHRAAEAASDSTRLQLAINYGECDSEWKAKP